jgi:NAD(P) transhydrogenase subunit alpha
MPEALLNNLYIFVLAMFTGFEVITKVPPLLHTPLMSGSNAISGISVVGALIITAAATEATLPGIWGGNTFILVLGVIAVTMGMINVAGGFLVTDRMLEMFKKKPDDTGGGKS